MRRLWNLRLRFWWPAKRRRWRRGVALFTLFVVIVGGLGGFTLTGDADRMCKGRELACGTATNLVFTGSAALASYLYLIGYRRRRVVHRYLQMVERNPFRLLPVETARASGLGVFARGDLIDRVSDELRTARAGGAQIVFGEAGAGKTTFLLQLAGHLAQRGALPVVVPLRGLPAPLQLHEMARTQLLGHVRAFLRSAAEGDKIWRALWAEGSVVILADGLDEAMLGTSTDERSIATKSALDAATSDRLLVVVTTRQEGSPLVTGYPEFELPPLTRDQAHRYVIDRSSVVAPSSYQDAAEVDQKLIERIIDVAGVTQTPFYLDIVSTVTSAGYLARLAATDGRQLRREMLDAYCAALVGQEIATTASLDTADDNEMVANIACVAGAMTLKGRLEATVTELTSAYDLFAQELALPSIDMARAVEDGRALSVIQTYRAQGDTNVRFAHSILQSYFLFCLLRRDKRIWSFMLRDAVVSRELADAISMWCRWPPAQPDAGEVGATLLDKARRTQHDASLMLAITAVDVMAASQTDMDVATGGFRAAWRQASRPAKLASIPRLETLRLPWGHAFLYEQTHDPDYAVRWAVAEALVNAGELAVTVMRAKTLATVEYAERTRPRQWRPPHDHDISALGVILPALRSNTSGQTRDEVGTYLHRLMASLYGGEDGDRGWSGRGGVPPSTEASLAQGFKLDAMRFPDEPIDPAALDLLHAARFWYSKIAVLHALCRRCVTTTQDPAVLRLSREAIVATATDEHEHPLVRTAARLCRRTLAEPRNWDRYLWNDETQVISRAKSDLCDEAVILVADVVLLLNLIEQQRVSGERRTQMQQKTDLPYCLRRSTARQLFFLQCDPLNCEFELCPYPTQVASLARGPLSAAFCRQQAVVSRSHSFGGWKRVRRRGVAEFWEEMANLARY
jgi:hypothetical protein